VQFDAGRGALFTGHAGLETRRFPLNNNGGMSGHSKWSTIKRKKGAEDAKRGKLFTKVVKEITIAARSGGGDPDGNPRLRRAIDAARGVNMPADNITRAIKKGTGELEGVQYEELVYEGIGADGALFVCEVVTDNRNRTIAEVRKVFDKNHGQIGNSGTAAWAFEQKGIVRIAGDATTEEELFEAAVGGGAENLERDGQEWVVTTARNDLDAVRDAIASAGIAVGEARLEYIPNNPKIVEGEDAEKLIQLYEALDDHDDIQNVFSDFELSEQALAEMA
jgi:YebC/PmpR family DNA-binding regulatory protein